MSKWLLATGCLELVAAGLFVDAARLDELVLLAGLAGPVLLGGAAVAAADVEGGGLSGIV